MTRGKVLSEVPGLGRVCRCPSCPDLHLSIGPVDIRIPQEALASLEAMVHQAVNKLRSEQTEKILSGAAKISWPLSSWNVS